MSSALKRCVQQCIHHRLVHLAFLRIKACFYLSPESIKRPFITMKTCPHSQNQQQKYRLISQTRKSYDKAGFFNYLTLTLFVCFSSVTVWSKEQWRLTEQRVCLIMFMRVQREGDGCQSSIVQPTWRDICLKQMPVELFLVVWSCYTNAQVAHT